MSKWKDTMKGGWHPEKNSAHPDSRTGLGIRSRANGMIPGRGNKDQDDRANHQSAPLSSLTDPSTFAPPPKRTGTGLTPAPPIQTAKRSVITAPSKYHDPRSGPVQPAPKISSERELQQLEAAPARPTSTGPYRVNTTGLSTDNLPAPPKRRDVPALPAPPSYDSAVASPGSGRPVPSLPPRLPARTNTGGSATSQGETQGMINQGAVTRLGAAGVSVPALGIGQSTASPPPPPRNNAPPAQVTSLQNRFAKLGTSTTNSSTAAATAAPAQPPAQGTTWQEKQAAMKTASAFQKDPSSVSFSDAKSAASTANNFRQRHGEQVAAGVKTANNVNQKYGVADRLGRFAGGQQQQQQQEAQEQQAAAVVPPQTSGVAAKKKPPPPPPKKKPGLLAASGGQAAQDDGPPPVPLSTRPTF